MTTDKDLPPLPDADYVVWWNGKQHDAWDHAAVRQAQREAIAADRAQRVAPAEVLEEAMRLYGLCIRADRYHVESPSSRNTEAMLAADKVLSDFLSVHLGAQRVEQAEPVAGWLQGVEAAAAWVDARREEFESEHGHVDPDTGALEFGSSQRAQLQEEYCGDLQDIADGIRGLAATPPASAPARTAGDADQENNHLTPEQHRAQGQALADSVAAQGEREAAALNNEWIAKLGYPLTSAEYSLLSEALAARPAGAPEPVADTVRLDWLLPNLHPANFGMEFQGGYEWDDNAEFLAKWRAAIDAELSATPPASAPARTAGAAEQGEQAAPVAEIAVEPPYWSRGHYYEGHRNVVRVLAALSALPVGTKLYAATPPASAPAQAEPIDMVLHCPVCHTQHIDEPGETRSIRGGELCVDTWDNPPHRSHLCHSCGHIWRPADVPTNGVQAVKTQGKNDSPNPVGLAYFLKGCEGLPPPVARQKEEQPDVAAPSVDLMELAVEEVMRRVDFLCSLHRDGDVDTPKAERDTLRSRLLELFDRLAAYRRV